MKILDLSGGKRNIWFNRLYPDAIFIDIRPEMSPTVLANSWNLPFQAGIFDLVVFDPPHMVHGEGSTMAEYYSRLKADEIKYLIRWTSAEAYRVSKPDSLLSFKWNDHDVRLDHILPLMEGYEPLFGHDFKRKPSQRSVTSWVLLRKRGGLYQNEVQLGRILWSEATFSETSSLNG
jgi:hypothetical protein